MRISYLSRNDFPANRSDLNKDVIAGLTVAIVALPLALGFAVTTGMSAAAGLTTAIIAGADAALFGGSRYQVSGPTGAMTVVLIPIVSKYGAKAIPALGLLAGIFVLLAAALRLGTVMNKVPWAVVEGFTVGIAIVIALQQLPLALEVVKADGDQTVIVAYQTLRSALELGLHWQSISVVILTLFVKFSYPKMASRFGVKFHIPASAVAILVTTLIVNIFSVSVHAIGEIPRSIGTWSGGEISVLDFKHLLLPALLIAILAAIESLLSARVADGMVHAHGSEKYSPNKELIGQGLATIGSSIFGGMPATGAIARTSVNVRGGAKTRAAAIFHSLTLLIVVLILAPIISAIPTAAIAGVLIGISYRILNPAAILESLRTTRSEATVLIITALVTLFIDLIWGIVIGILAHFAVNAINKIRNGRKD
jgi:SulP family sulfate permease